MLDLAKMNREATLPNALRWQWKYSTGHDPLRYEWLKILFTWFYLVSIVPTVCGVVFFCLSFTPEENTVWWYYPSISGAIGLFRRSWSGIFRDRVDQGQQKSRGILRCDRAIL